MISKDSLLHHNHPNFYNFFPRAIAPFTGSKSFISSLLSYLFLSTAMTRCQPEQTEREEGEEGEDTGEEQEEAIGIGIGGAGREKRDRGRRQ